MNMVVATTHKKIWLGGDVDTAELLWKSKSG